MPVHSASKNVIFSSSITVRAASQPGGVDACPAAYATGFVVLCVMISYQLCNKKTETLREKLLKHLFINKWSPDHPPTWLVKTNILQRQCQKSTRRCLFLGPANRYREKKPR